MMKKTLVFILICLFQLGVFAQQKQKKKDEIILEKKYTIPITEKLQIRSVKKTGKLKIVHLRPEVNPIFYDKQTFFHKLSVKKRKSFREVFNYPVLHASLSGGTNSWLTSSVGFQINGRKIIPSMFWNYTQFNNDLNSEFRFMNFKGGFRYNLSSQISMLLHINYEDGKQNYRIFYGVLPAWRQSGTATPMLTQKLESDYSIMHPRFCISWEGDTFTGEVQTGYLDLKQNLALQNQFQDTYLNYKMSVPFGGWYLWSSGQLHAVLSEITDLDTMLADGAYLQIEGGFGLQWKEIDLKLGAGYLKQDKVLSQDPDNPLYFTGELSAGIIPDVLTARAGYHAGFERTDIIYNLSRYHGVDLNLSGPNVIRNGIYATLDWMPVDSLIISGGWKQTSYSDLHMLTAISQDSIPVYAFALSHDNYQTGIFELSARYQTELFSFRGALNWMYWKGVNGIDHLPLFPEKLFDMEIQYRPGKWTYTLNAHFEGDRYLPGMKSPAMESFLDLGASIGYRLYNNVQVALTGQNLFNSDIENVLHLYYKSRMIGLQIKVTY